MVAPWQESAIKVVVEFKKGNRGASRVIQLTHTKESLPPQVYGRVTPQVWYNFMQEMEALAGYHPYTKRQDIGQCCSNLQGALCFICIGFGFFNPDGGNYRVWTLEVNNALAHHQQYFTPGGCRLSLKSVHGSYYVQIDIDPNMAVGYSVGAPTATPGPYDAAKPQAASYDADKPQPAYGGPPPAGYPSNPAPPAGYPSNQGPPAGYPSNAGPPAGYPSAQAPPYAGAPGAYGPPKY